MCVYLCNEGLLGTNLFYNTSLYVPVALLELELGTIVFCSEILSGQQREAAVCGLESPPLHAEINQMQRQVNTFFSKWAAILAQVSFLLSVC